MEYLISSKQLVKHATYLPKNIIWNLRTHSQKYVLFISYTNRPNYLLDACFLTCSLSSLLLSFYIHIP